jgi:hypothetical protein
LEAVEERKYSEQERGEIRKRVNEVRNLEVSGQVKG